MRLTPLRRAGLFASAAVAALATLTLAATAGAQPSKEPVTDDPRATPFLKNVDINHPEACTVGGLTGQTVHPNEFTYTGGDNEKHLNITAGPEGIKVTGIVVKGGDKFNVYLVGALGEMPWNELRSPFNNGGNIPDISHWFGCGVEDTTTTTTTTTPTETTTTTTTTTESTPPETTTTTASSSEEPTTTTTTTVSPVPVADTDELAATGFGSAWMLGLGAALVAAGAAVLLVMRRRSAS